MPRSLTDPAKLYQPGQIYRWSINQLTVADKAVALITTHADWPADKTVRVLWGRLVRDTGGSTGGTWNGGMTYQNGDPMTVIRMELAAESSYTTKRPFAGVTLEIEVYVAVTLAIDLHAE